MFIDDGLASIAESKLGLDIERLIVEYQRVTFHSRDFVRW